MRRTLFLCFLIVWFGVSCPDGGVVSPMVEGVKGENPPPSVQMDQIDATLSPENFRKVRELSRFFRANQSEMAQDLLPRTRSSGGEAQGVEEFINRPEAALSALAREDEGALGLVHTVMLGGNLRDAKGKMYGLVEDDLAKEFDEQLMALEGELRGTSRDADGGASRFYNPYLRDQSRAAIKGGYVALYVGSSATSIGGMILSRTWKPWAKIAGHVLTWTGVGGMIRAMAARDNWKDVYQWVQHAKNNTIAGNLTREEFKQLSWLSGASGVFSSVAWARYRSAWLAVEEFLRRRGLGLRPYGFTIYL